MEALRSKTRSLILLCIISVLPIVYIYLNDSRATNEILDKCRAATKDAWPPEDVTRLFDPITKRYNLQINPEVKLDEESQRMEERHFQMLTSLYRGPRIDGSLLKKIVRMDQALSISGEVPTFDVYPQRIDLPEAVRAIRNGEAVKQNPIHDPPLEVIRSPAHVCHPESKNQTKDLIVFIKSCATCSSNRNKCRTTYMRPNIWSNFSVQFVFVTGLPSPNSNSSMFFDGFRLDTHMKARATGSSIETDRKLLLEEADKFEDMLIGQFDDHYFNLTLKQKFTFRWAAVFCKKQSPIYLFVDDDYAIIPPKLIGLLKSIQPKDILPYANIGGEATNRVLRPVYNLGTVSSRWAVSKDDMPWNRYAGCEQGQAYFIGSELLIDAAIGGIFVKPFRIDDVFLGILWAKLHKRPYRMRGLLDIYTGNTSAVIRHEWAKTYFEQQQKLKL